MTASCPGCGALFLAAGLPPAPRLNASGECLAAYEELSARTLSLGDAEFAHQYAVDAYAASHAGGPSRPITTFFALAGLYLALERGFTGREVQLAHVEMAKGDKSWPLFSPSPAPPEITILDIEADLRPWMTSVWSAWTQEHPRIREATEALLPW